MKDGNYRVKFEVTFDTNSSGKLTNLNSKGITDQVRTTSGDTFSRSDSTLKAVPGGAQATNNNDKSLVTRSVGTCAIAEGRLYCWGYGVYGQNGNGTTNSLTTPTAVISPLAGKTVTKVSSSSDGDPANGYNHTCAIADGSLYCWGIGNNGQVGNGT
ncbi:TPA: hypothetical protein DHU97_03725, partial [Candidatus Saccharibacteria bacterium]|nr:hypothetical protein [Candidatus Saccharibacteria bacterium]